MSIGSVLLPGGLPPKPYAPKPKVFQKPSESGYDIKKANTTTSRIKSIVAGIPGISDSLADTPLGDFLGLSVRDVWRLKMKDPPETDFKGQFIAEELTENSEARFSEQTALNQPKADPKYLGGGSDNITFRTRVWADSSVKNVKATIELLKSFTKRNDELKRAPMFVYTSGTEFQVLCFVKSVTNILYDRPRPDGTIRGASFTVTLLQIENVAVPYSGLSASSLVATGLGVISAAAGAIGGMLNKIKIPGGSLHTKGRKVVVKQGETFEHIAKREYGDALVGDVLRRVYFNRPLSQIKMALDVGDVIDLVHRNEIFGVPIVPQSIALNLSDQQSVANLKDHFERRAGERTIYV